MNPNLGASARSLQDWIRLGADRGMAISVILRKRGDLSQRLFDQGVPHVVNAMYWPDRSRFVLSASHAWKLRRFLAAQGTQVLHCYEHDVYPFAVMMRSMTSLPLVCHVHFALEREFCEWAFGGTRKLPDALIWTSRQQQRDCESAVAGIIPSERQYVIPLGLDPAQLDAHPGSGADLRQRLGIAPQTIVIGLTCAFRPRKQIGTFLELIRHLTDRYTNVVGILAGGEVPGDEAYARDVIPRIEALQSHGRFFWLGHVEPIGPFLDATDVYVSTSNYETFGMGVLEAMATGKAIVAYRGGSVYEVLGRAGLVVDDDAREGLFHAVESLIESDALRRQLGAAARQRVADEFDPRRSLEQIQDVYRKLLRR
jgi:glycosyltransferase involved in cell wall biosynthesis